MRPFLPKVGRGCAGFAVEGVEEVAVGEEDAVLVDSDAAVAVAAVRVSWFDRVEAPDLAAGGGVEGDDAHLGRGGVENAVDDDGVALHFGPLKCVVGVIGPGYLELLDVGGRDLSEGGVADVVGAAVHGPAGVGGRRNGG